jgi:hypothetical protein
VWCIERHCIYCRGESEKQNYFSKCSQTASAHPSVIGRLAAVKTLVNLQVVRLVGSGILEWERSKEEIGLDFEFSFLRGLCYEDFG